MKLGERFQEENSSLSYADLHSEITKDAEDVQSNTLDDQKRSVRSPNGDDEVVKYMSNLPSYLKRGENVKREAFSVGVLDWRRLEKWQHSHKRTVQRTSRCSTSSTCTSSSHSTEASSSHSTRGRSCSPVNQRRHQPSFQPGALASPDEIDGPTIKSTEEKTSVVEESEIFYGNHARRAHMTPASDQTLKFRSGNEKEDSRKSELDSMMFQKLQVSRHLKWDVENARPEGKTEVQLKDCKYEKTVDQLEQSNAGVPGSELSERPNSVVILLRKNVPSSGKFEVSELPDSTANSEQKSSAGPSQGSISGNHPEAHHPEFDSAFSKIKQPISTDADPTKLASDVLRPLPVPARASISPGRSRNVEMRTSNVALMNGGKSSKGLDPKASKASDEKVRSSTPFRRLSISVSKIVKSSSSKEDPASSRSISKHSSAKSCLENLESSAASTARSRSSPLRRMLDPLLKPKVSNCNHSYDSSKKNSDSIERAFRSSKGQPDSSAAQPAKAKLDLTSCRSINVDNSHVEKKSGSSVVQALLRVAFKNGLPLITFAVDNDGDILAATMKECSSSSVKDNSSWIYTFLTIREVKKKNGSWINQGGRGKRQDYVPNVVAQMRVSDSLPSNLREFVLFSVEPRKQNQHPSEFQPNNELAAIVSQIPLKLYPSSARNGHHGAASEDLDHEDLVNMTVILPSGVHSLPSKGGPSSLIQRWRSGGSCDCGGWDLGCQLKVLSGDHHRLREKLIPEAPSAKYQFSLFPQVDTEENPPEFTMAPFKEGIYSIEYNSSLSVLQAFSVCIAVLESRKMTAKLEDHNLSVGISSGETLQSPNGDLPTKYVPNPPLSPVGRV